MCPQLKLIVRRNRVGYTNERTAKRRPLGAEMHFPVPTHFRQKVVGVSIHRAPFSSQVTGVAVFVRVESSQLAGGRVLNKTQRYARTATGN